MPSASLSQTAQHCDGRTAQNSQRSSISAACLQHRSSRASSKLPRVPNPVGCFWDYENLPVSSKIPNGEVGHAAAFREVAQKHGIMIEFKAYLEVHTLKPHRRDLFHSMGVTLVDCPHRGQKEVADKMMIVDMMLFAIDNPPPATLIVASSDRDYLHTISVLRMRQYSVIVITKDEFHPSMLAQATPPLGWQDFVARTQELAAMSPQALTQLLQPSVPQTATLSLRPATSSSLEQLRSPRAIPSPPSRCPRSAPIVTQPPLQGAAVTITPLPHPTSSFKSTSARTVTPVQHVIKPRLPIADNHLGHLQLSIQDKTQEGKPIPCPSSLLPSCNPFFTPPSAEKPLSTKEPADDDYSIIDDFADATNVDWDEILPATQSTISAVESIAAPREADEESEYEFEELPFCEADWEKLDMAEKNAVADRRDDVNEEAVLKQTCPENSDASVPSADLSSTINLRDKESNQPLDEASPSLGSKRRRASIETADPGLPITKKPQIFNFSPLVAYIRRSLRASGDHPLLSELEAELGDAQGLALCRLFGFDNVAEYVTAAIEKGCIFPIDESGLLVLREATWMKEPDWDQFVWKTKRPWGSQVESPESDDSD